MLTLISISNFQNMFNSNKINIDILYPTLDDRHLTIVSVCVTVRKILLLIEFQFSS